MLCSRVSLKLLWLSSSFHFAFPRSHHSFDDDFTNFGLRLRSIADEKRDACVCNSSRPRQGMKVKSLPRLELASLSHFSKAPHKTMAPPFLPKKSNLLKIIEKLSKTLQTTHSRSRLLEKEHKPGNEGGEKETQVCEVRDYVNISWDGD